MPHAVDDTWAEGCRGVGIVNDRTTDVHYLRMLWMR